jgi:signal transduction histidine kinase/CheY-like chemotaxis protein
MSSNSREDFANLIRISSAQIVCFDLATPLSCAHDADSFTALLYTTPTQCTDGSITCAHSSGFEDVESMLGQSLERILPAYAGYDKVFKQWHNHSLSGQSFEVTLTPPGRPATALSVAIYGRIDDREQLSRFWIVLRDITPQMRATRAVASTELHYRKLIEGAGVIFARVTPSGYYEYISPSLAEALGVSLEDIAAKRRKLCEWVHPDDHQKVERLLAARDAEHASSVTELELRVRLFGEYRILSVRQLTALEPMSNHVSFIDLIASDITHLRTVEVQLAQLTARSRPEHRDAVISHDIRNHLTACLGHLENVLHGIKSGLSVDTASLQAAVLAARTSSELASSLSKSDSESLAKDRPRCDVAEVLSQLKLLVTPLLPEHVHLRIPALHAEIIVPLSRSQLENALLNLTLNARDALGADGGEIIITAATNPTSGMAIVRVQDDGPGIASDIITHIFEPYFSTKRATGGTGLGLLSVRNAIAAAGGSIEVDSSPTTRRGTVFTLTLPRLHLEEAKSQSVPTNNASSEPPPSLRILIAEDELGICSMLQVALGRRGHTVDVVSDSERFMAQAAKGANFYDLLLIDESLPRKKSSTVLPYLRSLMPRTPIIVTSGDPTIKDAVQGVASSVFFLSKPFSLVDLECAIRTSCR